MALANQYLSHGSTPLTMTFGDILLTQVRLLETASKDIDEVVIITTDTTSKGGSPEAGIIGKSTNRVNIFKFRF